MTMKPLSTFIISMAVLDLVTCTLILPGEIYHLLHIWDFTEPLICQIYEFLSALLVISSGFMLVAIAMIRYMMICHSFKKQVILTHAKCICSLNIFIATVASIPHGILKGKHSRQTQNPNIVGYSCQVDDSYVETIWPSLNSAFFFLLFFLTSCTVTFCYVRIGCAIRGHGQNVNQRSSLPASTKAAKDVTETDTAVNATVSKTDESRSTYGDTSESVVANETINNTASASIYRAHDTIAGLVPSVALEQESTIAFIPTFVYLGLLAVVGIPGNSLVLIIYLTKMTIKPLSIFILSMAAIDLITCLLILPGETYRLLHIWYFTEPIACQIYMALCAQFVISSGLMLVAIAIIRYMKICHSLKKQVTLTQTKCICSFNIFIALVFSVPHGILQGKHSRKTQNPNIVGYYCQVDGSFVPTIWPKLNSASLFLLFFVTSSIIAFCYVRIGCAIRDHGKNVHQRNSLQATAQVSKGVAVLHTEVKATHLKDTTNKESSLSYGVDDTSESVDATVIISDLSDINTATIPNNSIRTIVENYNVNKSTSSENTCSDNYSRNKIALDGIIIKQRLDTFKKSYGKQGGALKKQRKQLSRTHLMMLTVTLVFFSGFSPLPWFKCASCCIPRDSGLTQRMVLGHVSVFFRFLFCKLCC
nr:neurotensin receptor type 1-like [Biomphalaria glabrata]